MPFRVVREFEAELCGYTGSRFAVTTTSCTMALLLACAWFRWKDNRMRSGSPVKTSLPISHLVIPKRTYVSVPMSIKHAGYNVFFRDQEWSGTYRLEPLPIWDCARRFTAGMYVPGQFQCVSFHWGKILGIQQGGAILHDDPEADEWLRRARFDGRREGVAPKDDTFTMLGWHCYMSPEVAAQGLVRLKLLSTHNEDLPNDDYPDLSKMEIFR